MVIQSFVTQSSDRFIRHSAVCDCDAWNAYNCKTPDFQIPPSQPKDWGNMNRPYIWVILYIFVYLTVTLLGISKSSNLSLGMEN